MAHYAKIEDGVVTNVIVAEQEFIDELDGHWVQTSYNTLHGRHLLGGVPMRKNYATIGGLYDSNLDAFYSKPPYASWVLDAETCDWLPPLPYPPDGDKYMWDEELKDWSPVASSGKTWPENP
jgi:hypothetical protein